MATTKRTVAESGFKVTVDADTSFRLADLDPYRELSGLHLKEMDVGWWDSSTSMIFLLELKGSTVWDAFDSSKNDAHNHLVANLRDKATDAMLILAAVRVGTIRGKLAWRSNNSMERTAVGRDPVALPAEGWSRSGLRRSRDCRIMRAFEPVLDAEGNDPR